ncbi:hypothetical protein CLIB1444_01S18008 [[Candida] jaroonii]|uniref:Uncharacterized protein n=1 Tax=[Candida] jaroonii TaxID=467808 RepID=A0ACA9Y2V2_9ASCO|nr:hypothetical protein CLIB1444_01S18008 [[Candida] jaroonii]
MDYEFKDKSLNLAASNSTNQQNSHPQSHSSQSSHPHFNFLQNFEFSNYPMTNPPLFDQSMFLYQDGQQPPRRRISISNGQIGQIVNHEAIYDDFDSQDFDIDKELNSLSGQQSQSTAQTTAQPTGVIPPPSVPPSSLPPPQSTTQIPVNAPPITPQSGVTSSNPSNNSSNIPSVPAIPPAGGFQPKVDHSHFAGVPPPDHQLIYNNEVIYNPHNGPVPGTAAWKKDRLLERNRIAASKCRKRKKQAQQQLVDDLNDLKSENRLLQEKLNNYENLLDVFKDFYIKSSNLEVNNFKKFDFLSDALKSKNYDEMLEVIQKYK